MTRENRPEILQTWMNKIFEDTLQFGEFILAQYPDVKNTELISKLRLLQEKIKKGDQVFFQNVELDNLQEETFQFYVKWNEVTKNHAMRFYKAIIEMNNQPKPFLFDKKDHPFKNLIENLEKYKKANKVVMDILKKYDTKLVDIIDFYSILFTIVIMSESVEYFFREDFSRFLEKYNITNIDVSEIFSVTKKWSDKHGIFQPDIRMMRNAISHFNFNIEYQSPPDEFKITFYPKPKGNQETRWFYSTDFMKFIGNYRNLLTTFEHIIILMMTFSLLRHFQKMYKK